MARSKRGAGRIWHLDEPQKLIEVATRLARARTRHLDGPLHRAVFARHLEPMGRKAPEPLYYAGSLGGGRFTPPGGPAGLYLSFDPSTPPAEIRTVFFEGGVVLRSAEHDPFVTICVRTSLSRVLDLTDKDTLTDLELTEDQLDADWLEEQRQYMAGLGPMPATQFLAQVAHVLALFSGIKFHSRQTVFGDNLVVFPDRLEPGDSLHVIDPSGRYAQRLP